MPSHTGNRLGSWEQCRIYPTLVVRGKAQVGPQSVVDNGMRLAFCRDDLFEFWLKEADKVSSTGHSDSRLKEQ